MLALHGIGAGYDGTTVVRGVDLTVPDRSVVALLGPNGAGKTTLLRVASGLLAPTMGSVMLDDVDVTGWRSHERAAAGICHIPEGRGIFASLTVRDNLRLQAGPRMVEEAVERVADVFPILGERLDQIAGTLSGGQQQMLALSRAYLARARVVLLDEVSMGLAPNLVDVIFEFLHRLASEGLALLVVEQYVRRALDLADYVYLLDRGAVSFAGEPAEVFRNPDVLDSYLGAESKTRVARA